jgi:23S rRNA (adenine-N6)-dimethyltransferase
MVRTGDGWKPPSGKGGTARDVARRALAQNFLADPRLAAEIVRAVNPRPDDLVLEIGAGRGDLTEHLLAAGCDVIAVEADPHWARRLRERFRSEPRLRILQRDIMTIQFPHTEYRAFGNIPFNLSTAIMRRLFAVDNAPMQRADLIVQWQVARKRASRFPRAVNSLLWQACFDFTIKRRIPAHRFRPMPSVDAALLIAIRRPEPLVPAQDLKAFEALLRQGFSGQGQLYAMLRSFLSREQTRRLLADLGATQATKAPDLNVEAWARIFQAMRELTPPHRWAR